MALVRIKHYVKLVDYNGILQLVLGSNEKFHLIGDGDSFGENSINNNSHRGLLISELVRWRVYHNSKAPMHVLRSLYVNNLIRLSMGQRQQFPCTACISSFHNTITMVAN